MSDGNKRYLGDVFINQENLERQIELFKSVIDTYQYKNNGSFDASTLQGHQASDFATSAEGEMARNALQAPLYIGKSALINKEDRQTIQTDGILLEDDNEEGSVGYRLQHISWYTGDADNPIISVSEALIRIYNNARSIKQELEEQLNTKVDMETYEEFIRDEFTPIKEQYNQTGVEYINSDTGETKIGVNADLVNGLRPILITERGYQDMLESDDPEIRARATYWRNIFIFVEDIPGDYNAPYEYSLTDPYSFRINGEYLQVKNNLASEWVNMALLSDFLAGANFGSVIKDYLEQAEDIQIGTTSLLNSLQLISPTSINEDWENYPFLSSSLHDNYVNKITIDGANTLVNEIINNGFKTVNLDLEQLLIDKEVLNDDGSTRINGMNNALNGLGDELQTQRSDLNTAQSNLRTVQQSINTLQESDVSQNSTLATIQNQLTTLNNNISTINSKINTIQTNINNINTWQSTTIAVNDSQCLYGKVNPSLRLVFAKVNDIFNYKKSKSNQYIKTGERVVSAYRPIFDITFASHTPYTVGMIDKDGYVWGKSTWTNDKSDLNLIGSCCWRY